MQINTIKVESTNVPIISVFTWAKLTGILKLGIKTTSTTSEATTAHLDLSFHSISQKQATRFPNWKIVWIFYASTKNRNTSTYLSIFEQFHICGNFKQRFPIQNT
jgi:hypothetical protein